MQAIPITEIIVGDRQRTEPSKGHIQELKKSILSDGLFHPIVLSHDHHLVAGFCRLTAMKEIAADGLSFLHNRKTFEPGLVPYVYANTIEERALFRAELEENLRRENLTPADRARAIAKLHKLFSEENAAWTQTNTAEKLVEKGVLGTEGSGNVVVSRSLLVAQFADDPDVQKATSDKEAYNIARKKTEATLMQALGLIADEIPEDAIANRVIEGDFLQAVAGDQLPRDFFDCIIMDPPYGVGADTFGDQSHVMGHQYADDFATFESFLRVVNDPAFLQSCKDQAHLFIFLDIRNFQTAYEWVSSADWYVWQTPLIWYKGGTGHAPQPDQGPKRSYEAILYANRGRRPVRKTGTDVLSYPAVVDKIHAAQKPPELYRELLNWSCNPGDRVLDPCCGSGTIFEAAPPGLVVYGYEMNPQYAAIAKSRIMGDSHGDESTAGRT